MTGAAAPPVQVATPPTRALTFRAGRCEHLVGGVMDEDVVERRLIRPDGRVVAWLDCCVADGIPVLKVPGTPGARWDIREDRSDWISRGLRMISTERPGFGASSRLSGRAFREHADDLAAILDASDIDRVYVLGGSGASAHILSFLSRHPDRAVAAAVTVGVAPLDESEVDGMIEINRTEWHLMQHGDRDAVRANLRPYWEESLADPLAGIHEVLDGGPEADRAVLQDARWLAGIGRAIREALSTEDNFEAWIDESFALTLKWDDIDLTSIATSITWYHGRSDTTAPFSAAERLVGRLPTARLVEVHDAGHFAGFDHVGDILDELLSRS
jgi:pimeloyl-ACP methyl ester carboxylesterase